MPSLSSEDFQREFVDLTATLVEDIAAELSPERRAKLAVMLTEGFCRMWAGGYIYVPHGLRPMTAGRDCKAHRDALLRAEHDGTKLSVHRLSRRYGLSEIAVYRILAAPPDT